MNRILREIVFWILYTITATGVGFLLAGVLMALTGIGQRPWLATLIGLALLALVNILADRMLHKCPQCGSHLLDETGRCQVCDYNPTSHHSN